MNTNISDSMATHSFGARFSNWITQPFSRRSVPVSSDLRHEFFKNTQEFISNKLGHFLKDSGAHSYMMHTNSRDGVITLSFAQMGKKVPELKDIQSFVQYLNDVLYLEDHENSANPFSVSQTSSEDLAQANLGRKAKMAAEFTISFDGTIYGYEFKTMRSIAEDLATLSEDPKNGL
jgi:hypothetical protein